jgi:hypothetical protein
MPELALLHSLNQLLSILTAIELMNDLALRMVPWQWRMFILPQIYHLG